MSTKRWLDEASDADGFERSLLESGLDAEPPPHAEDQVWKQVLTAVAPPIGPGPGGGTTGVAAAAKGATVTTLGKGFLLGVAASVAVAGADRVISHRSPSTTERPVAAQRAAPEPSLAVVASGAPPARAPAIVSPSVVPGEHEPSSIEPTSTVALARTAPVNRTLPTHGVDVPPATGAPASVAAQGSVAAFPLPDAPRPLPKSRLEEEAALLQKARTELRSGALAGAFATLEASREKFSAPELYQEREALLIELLYRSGQRERARERASAFLARFPESPHAAGVRAFVDSPK